MKKSEIIKVLERNLKILKSSDIPEEVNIFHTLDTGGYGGDCVMIYDFDFGFSFDKDEEVMFFEYYGDENPGTNGVV
ncbi:MAG: hypothetical protein L7S72_07315 [Flavobacteriales bacterium]|nr:hypothetical protein [Flavobacteriales bacterium]